MVRVSLVIVSIAAAIDDATATDVLTAATAVRRGVIRLSRRLRAERPAHDVTLLQLAVLAELNDTGPMTPGQLAAAQRVQPQSLTRVLASRAGQRVLLVSHVTPIKTLVAAALLEELALLSTSSRRVLEGASVAGDPFAPELAAAAADVSEQHAMDAIDELLRQDLIRLMRW